MVYDALGNWVGGTSDVYWLANTWTYSHCEWYVQSELDSWTYWFCFGRSSAVTLDFSAEVIYGGVIVDILEPTYTTCAGWGLNVYTVVEAENPLLPEQPVYSPNGVHELKLQSDGNLVLYSNGSPVWASGTFGTPVDAKVQTDGNFVVYHSGGQAVWDTGTYSPGAFLAVRDNGVVVLYDTLGNVLWRT